MFHSLQNVLHMNMICMYLKGNTCTAFKHVPSRTDMFLCVWWNMIQRLRCRMQKYISIIHMIFTCSATVRTLEWNRPCICISSFCLHFFYIICIAFFLNTQLYVLFYLFWYRWTDGLIDRQTVQNDDESEVWIDVTLAFNLDLFDQVSMASTCSCQLPSCCPRPVCLATADVSSLVVNGFYLLCYYVAEHFLSKASKGDKSFWVNKTVASALL